MSLLEKFMWIKDGIIQFFENFFENIKDFPGNFNDALISVFLDEKTCWAALVFTFTLVLVLISSLSNMRRNKKHYLPTYWVFAVGSFLSVFLLFRAQYISSGLFENPFLSSVVSTAKIFTFGYDWLELDEIISAANGSPIANKMLLFASATAPLLTATGILSALSENVASYWTKVIYFRRLHIFSELNEKSICLAEDIYRNSRFWRPVKIVFANTAKEDMTDEKNDIWGRVKLIKGLTTRKSVLDLTGHYPLKPKYYLISSDETHNVENCVSLFDKIKRRGSEIYIFSMLDSTEMFIDSIDKKKNNKKSPDEKKKSEKNKTGKKRKTKNKAADKSGDILKNLKKFISKIWDNSPDNESDGKKKSNVKQFFDRIRLRLTDTDAYVVISNYFAELKESRNRYKTRITLINEAKMATYNILLKHPLYSGADKFGEKEIFLVVIGGSKIAREFVKAALWCGQMNEFTFKMKIIDNGGLEDEFEKEFGDLKGKAEQAGITLNYKFIKADLESSELVRVLEEQCLGANYFFISTEDDELTVNISQLVKTNVYRRRGNNEYPVFVPIIGNMDYYQIAKNFDDANDEIEYYPSGCYSDIYKKKYITNNVIIRLSRLFNIIYNIKHANDSIEDFYKKPKENEADEAKASLLEILGFKTPEGVDNQEYINLFDLLKKVDKNGKKSFFLKRKTILDYYNYWPLSKKEIDKPTERKAGDDKSHDEHTDKKPPRKFNKNTYIKKSKRGILGYRFARNRMRERLDNFDTLSEVTKQSNMAGVIHIFYKMRDLGLEVVTKKKDSKRFSTKRRRNIIKNLDTVFKEVPTRDGALGKEDIMKIICDEERIRNLARIEHNRWVVFQLVGGWEVWDTSDIPEGEKIPEDDPRRKHKDNQRKLHVCIVHNDELPALAKKLDKKDKEYHFLKNDSLSVRVVEFGLLESLNSEMGVFKILFGFKKLYERRKTENFVIRYGLETAVTESDRKNLYETNSPAIGFGEEKSGNTPNTSDESEPATV